MLDFRKFFLASALLTITAGLASAQVVIVNPLTPPSCVAQAAGTPSIRAEGVAELTGDVLVICSGGTPTPFNQNLPQVNIQVFTSPSINITSRILSSGTLNNFTEALLFVDEPTPANQTICGSTAYPNSIPTNQGGNQVVVSGVCGAHLGTGNGIGTYDPNVAVNSSCIGPNQTIINNCNSWRGNTYQARQASANSLIWQGVPFDPPGTQTTRILRISNVRVNASQLGVPSGAQASVSLIISTSASGVINPIALPITNPAPTVAIAQNSLTFSVESAITCLQCESGNKDFANASTNNLTNKGTNCDNVAFSLRYQELFPTVFRRRTTKQPSPAITGGISPNPDVPQDTLGVIYQSETGFHKVNASNRWPSQLAPNASQQNTSLIAGTTSGTLGLADNGTRLIARLSNVQNGVQVWMETTPQIVSPQANNVRTGTARMVTTDPNGAGPFSPTPGGATPALLGAEIAQISIVGGTGQAVYEIIDTDTTAIERVNIRVIIAYVSNTSSNLPALGTSTSNGNLAPISTVSTASTSASLPRFVDTATTRNMLTINSCRTNILFPFVTNQAGFDTGLAISNTSQDPFGTALQTGACTVNFYGNVGASKVTLAYPSPSITGGEHFVWSLSSGGAVTATAGFQGYVIAQCAFQYGHGYAFISDIGSQRLAMGYLALVMDDAIGSRTGSRSEVLGH